MYGKHPVFAAMANQNRKINEVYCLENLYKNHKPLLDKYKIRIVDNNFFTSKLGEDSTHQGIMANVTPIPIEDFTHIDFSSDQDRIVILDQVTDPQNIGAIIRSAAAFGIKKFIIPNDGSPRENATIAKAACGCLELVQIYNAVNLKNTIDFLKKKNYWIVGLDAKGTNTIEETSKITKLVIVIGSEGKGMRRLTAESCDFKVSIPISKDVESLNASNAASIIFYLFRM